MNCTVEKKRGYRPSDLIDPSKRQYLLSLSKKLWHEKKVM